MSQGINFEYDWKTMPSEKGIEIVRRLEQFGMSVRRSLPSPPMDVGYVVTVDNMTKMISILMRLKNQLPVVIMGETGYAVVIERSIARENASQDML